MEELLNETKVPNSTQARNEPRVCERGQRKTLNVHLAVIVLSQIEARLANQNADEAVVIDAENAAIGLGHFVEDLNGFVDESCFNEVGDLRAVYEALSAKTSIHIRVNA